MPHTLLPWLYEIFPVADEHYTMRQILERLQANYSGISRSATYRALKALRRSSATRDLVRAVNENDGDKTRVYYAEGARLIAKRATRSRPPKDWRKPPTCE